MRRLVKLLRLTLFRSAAPSSPTAGAREAVAEVARGTALVMLSVAIVLSPFRARIVLESRGVPPVYSDYRDLLLFWNEIAILACLVFWAASMLLKPRPLELGPIILRIPVFALLAAVILSAPFSVDLLLSSFHAMSVFMFVGLALFVLNEVEDVNQLVPALAAMVVIQAVIAVAQFVGQESFGLEHFGELKLDPEVGGVSIVWTEGHPKLLRAYGMTDHPNILGGVIAFAILLIGSGLSRCRGTRATLSNLAFGLGMLVIALTFSRSAVLALVAGGGLALTIFGVRRDWPEVRDWFVALAIGGLLALMLLKPFSAYVAPRVNPAGQEAGSTEERSFSEREALIRNTNEIFVKHPLTGVGLAALPTAMREAFPNFEYDYAPAHVAIVVVAAEIGLLGAFAYGLLMVIPWVMLWFYRRRLSRELIGVSGALLAVTVVGFFDYYTWSLTPGRIWFWLVLALWAVEFRRSTRRSADA